MRSPRDPRLVIEQLRQLVEAWDNDKRITAGTLCTLLAISPRTLHHYCVQHLRVSWSCKSGWTACGTHCWQEKAMSAQSPLLTASRNSAISPAFIAHVW